MFLLLYTYIGHLPEWNEFSNCSCIYKCARARTLHWNGFQMFVTKRIYIREHAYSFKLIWWDRKVLCDTIEYYINICVDIMQKGPKCNEKIRTDLWYLINYRCKYSKSNIMYVCIYIVHGQKLIHTIRKCNKSRRKFCSDKTTQTDIYIENGWRHGEK